MDHAHLHDQLVLLNGSKRHPVPGVSRVAVALSANVDTQATPAAGTAVVQLNEATAEVEVQVTMWTTAQWQAYQSLLAMFRRGAKDGPAVFTSAHPEIRARRMKRLYFSAETSQPYSPQEGYRVTLRFKEKLKDATRTQGVTDTQGLDSVLGVGATPAATAGNSTAAERALSNAMLSSLISPPAPADGGRATTAVAGYCSAAVRVAGTATGLPAALFGGTALSTEANFRRAGMSTPWNADSQKNLRVGQIVFFGGDATGQGHAGVVTGFDKDGMPLVSGNSIPTYLDRGGRLDARGNPLDRNIDARGTVRLNRLGTPTSVGLPGGVPKATPRIEGPAAPLPPQRPSAAIPQPPGR
ncbi:hypothetical protein [Deinococcus petrolearius]|uniref:Peptidase C51 domain-containing protein n=1 Tax=Deinococcus petrolearius TaxID=1751295 RepID=A0ABW1DGY0_9DEIO